MRNSLWIRLAAAVVFAGLVAFNSPAGKAQQGAPNSPASNPLGLSPAQTAKIKDLEATAVARQTAIQKNTTLTQTEQQQELTQLHSWFMEQANDVLTPAQRAEAASRRAASNAKIAQLRALSAKIEASITPAQKAQIQAIQQGAQAQFQTIVGNKSLTNAEKTTQVMALRTGNQAKLKAILTPSQAVMVDQMKTLQLQLMAIQGSAPPPH